MQSFINEPNQFTYTMALAKVNDANITTLNKLIRQLNNNYINHTLTSIEQHILWYKLYSFTLHTLDTCSTAILPEFLWSKRASISYHLINALKRESSDISANDFLSIYEFSHCIEYNWMYEDILEYVALIIGPTDISNYALKLDVISYSWDAYSCLPTDMSIITRLLAKHSNRKLTLLDTLLESSIASIKAPKQDKLQTDIDTLQNLLTAHKRMMRHYYPKDK